jgi:hypothetical protein
VFARVEHRTNEATDEIHRRPITRDQSSTVQLGNPRDRCILKAALITQEPFARIGRA